jgi:anaerobic magnesium-protoporphyrin IX monomethyl ester cyclase
MNGDENRMKTKLTEDLDILFILPPLFVFMESDFPAFPSGLGYMVSYLKQKGKRAQIYNADIYQPEKNSSSLIVRGIKKIIKYVTGYSYYANRYSIYYSKVTDRDNPIWKEIVEVLKKTNPKLVGISCSVLTIPSAVIISKIAKEVLPGVKVIVGGPAATTCSEELIIHDSIDYLVLGEGEETIAELSSYLLDYNNNSKDPNNIRGITYKSGGRFVKTAPRPLIENLDTIPLPDRNSMFVLDRYNEIRYISANADILTSRGCPYPCKFCCSHVVWGTRKTRFRTVNNIIEELIYLKTTFGQRSFIFWDDLFTADRERTINLCESIIANNLEIEWICLVRLNTIDAELLNMMKRAGCREIQVGIESGSDRILRHIGKNITLDMIRNQVPVIKKSGLDWGIFLIVGFPSETKDEMKATLNLISQLKPTWVNLSIFSPYPGTDFYYELREKGLLGENIMKSDFWYPYNNYTGTMSDKEFIQLGISSLRIVDSYNTRLSHLLMQVSRRLKSIVNPVKN